MGKKLEEMVRLNRTRMDSLERFQRMIAEYNAGSSNVELFFDELLAMAIFELQPNDIVPVQEITFSSERLPPFGPGRLRTSSGNTRIAPAPLLD